ncbi:DUF3261 domain-containing protein [Piscinibacter sp.]|jgi:hypothetical protein|uniref:DUF3261 domain-containing protein n=1 Tax=Piscinibacter sp. TaxID=1903157 RepID=UPI0035599A42
MSASAFPLRCVVLLAALLLGCATPPAGHREAPLLRLAPAALGRTLALQQQLVVEARGQTQRVDVLLEADADAVRLALLNLGQTVARLEWDGQQLQETRAAWWPAEVRSERILSDLQLVWWPADAVRAALPAGWALSASPAQRELVEGSELVTVVRYLSPTLVELDNRRAGYRLRIESVPLN